MKGCARLTLLAEPLLTVDTAGRYQVIEPTYVRAFVATHPHLIPTLEDAPVQIDQFFPDAPLSLEAHVDPDDQTETLILRIHTERPQGFHSPGEALTPSRGGMHNHATHPVQGVPLILILIQTRFWACRQALQQLNAQSLNPKP